MSKSNIILIVVLMSLASFGLMGFQFYWVKNAIRINRERFDQNVHLALTGTIEQLEKGENSDAFYSFLIQDSTIQKSLFERIDPLQIQYRSRPNPANRPSLVDTFFQESAPKVSPTFKRILESRGVDSNVLEDLETFFTNMTPEVASKLFTPDELEVLLKEKERRFEYLNRVENSTKKRNSAASMACLK